jgi:hypothetical protein
MFALIGQVVLHLTHSHNRWKISSLAPVELGTVCAFERFLSASRAFANSSPAGEKFHVLAVFQRPMIDAITLAAALLAFRLVALPVASTGAHCRSLLLALLEHSSAYACGIRLPTDRIPASASGEHGKIAVYKSAGCTPVRPDRVLCGIV